MTLPLLKMSTRTIFINYTLFRSCGDILFILNANQDDEYCILFTIDSTIAFEH